MASEFEMLKAELFGYRQRGADALRKALADVKTMARRAIRRTPKAPKPLIDQLLSDPRIKARMTLQKAHEALDNDIGKIPAAEIAERERRLHAVTVDLRARGML